MGSERGAYSKLMLAARMAYGFLGQQLKATLAALEADLEDLEESVE